MELKCVFIGDQNVGKTSILNRYTYGSYNQFVQPTIGSSMSTQAFNTKIGMVKFNLWDTAGQERYRSIVPIYIKDASIIVIVFDLSNDETFEHLGEWFNSAKETAPQYASYVVVGNKLDLKPDVNLLFYQQECLKYNAQFCAVSALSGQNIEILFSMIADSVSEQHVNQPLPSTANIENASSSPQNQSKCC